MLPIYNFLSQFFSLTIFYSEILEFYSFFVLKCQHLSKNIICSLKKKEEINKKKEIGICISLVIVEQYIYIVSLFSQTSMYIPVVLKL